jgi:hypothetical protein
VSDGLGEKPRHEDSLIGFDLFGGLQEEDGALLGHRDTVLAEDKGDERTPLDGGRSVKHYGIHLLVDAPAALTQASCSMLT